MNIFCPLLLIGTFEIRVNSDIIKMSDCDVSKKSGGDGAMTSADFDYVRFTWSDIHGVARCKSVPRRHVTAMLEEGVGIPIGEVLRNT